jgi:hypothetical protein
MSDFLRGVLNGFAEGEDGKGMSEAFDLGQKLAVDCRKAIIDGVTPLYKAGKMMEASVALFVAVWLTVEWAQSGVDASEEVAQKEGRHSPVKRVWDGIRIGLTAKDPAEAMAKLNEMLEQIKRDER